jgi:serine/threonine-protein kinase
VTDLAERLQAHLGDGATVQRELTGGGMSRVFVAHERALERDVVVKLMSSQMAAAVSAERFRREVMLSAALQHPNIVPVLSAGEMDGVPYYVMPFIKGESVRARLRRGPLSIRETVNVLKDVARALEHAHARGVVHRDIKPDNILLTSGAATVADFGVAKAITAARQGSAPSAPAQGTMTGVGMSLGTPAYMAPEQAVGDPNVDHRADLYALGVVAYEMLAGASPFHGRSPQALVAAHLSEAPAPIATRRYDVPPGLESLVMRLLEKDPSRRPKSAAQVLRALDEVELGSGGIAVPADRPRSRRGRQRRTALLAGAAGAAVLAAVGAWAALAASTDDANASVAVLPLRAVTRDSVETTFADGVASELTSAVAQLGAYRVASQTVTRASQGESRAGTARALGAALLVEGSAQRERGALRVSVRLVDARRDSTLWATTRTGSADSVLALQDSVVGAVMSALRARVPRR